jgi:hypothetical protein
LHIIYCDADKRPIGPHGWYSAVADAESIARLEHGPNIGVATGKLSGIVAVDIDPRNGGDKTFAEALAWLPPTRTHRTRGGGQHLIYRYPATGIRNFTGTNKNGLPGIELKSDGYGVVWPPSPGYSVIDDRLLADCPDRLRDLTKGMGVTSKPDDLSVTPIPFFPEPIEYELNYANRALLNAWYELHNCPAGCRNHLLNVLAYKMGRLIVRGWVRPDRVEDLLLRACAANGLLAEDGEKQCRDTLASGIKAGMQLPYHDIRWRVAETKKEMGVTLKPGEEEPK